MPLPDLVNRSAIALAIVAFGCSQPPVMAPGPQTPNPTLPPPAQASSPHVSSFEYEPGVMSYRVLRRATIEEIEDPGSIAASDSSTNIAHEVLSLERIGDTIQFALVADTLTAIAPGRAGVPQSVQLPARIKGFLTADSLVVTDDSLQAKCSPAQSTLRSDIQSLLVHFPDTLTSGTSWKDSVNVQACQGMIQTTGTIRRYFRVTGESSISGIPAMIVERTDSIRGHGDGAQQQHRVVLDIVGSGSMIYYLSTSGGRLLLASSDQQLVMTVATSEKTAHFRQRLKQEFSLTP